VVLGAIAIFADTFNVLRSIGANPVSTLGVLIQGALAFIGASAFTEAGRKLLIDKFSRFGKRTFKGWARTALALVIFLVTLGFWFIVPVGAAWYFHWVGDKYYREGLYEPAANSFRQASTLRPYVISYHASLARAEEKSTNFDKAISEYKSLSALYERPGTTIDDAYFFAKCDLVRLLISHTENYALAEKLINDLQPKVDRMGKPNHDPIQYLLLTYKGWIEFKRKHLNTARSELQFVTESFDEGATAHYLLALVLEELKKGDKATGKGDDAKEHHARFLRLLQKPQPDEVPLDWISYAQERMLNP
jgi:tetratricopeptide (TPR) repeat protein